MSAYFNLESIFGNLGANYEALNFSNDFECRVRSLPTKPPPDPEKLDPPDVVPEPLPAEPSDSVLDESTVKITIQTIKKATQCSGVLQIFLIILYIYIYTKKITCLRIGEREKLRNTNIF